MPSLLKRKKKEIQFTVGFQNGQCATEMAHLLPERMISAGFLGLKLVNKEDDPFQIRLGISDAVRITCYSTAIAHIWGQINRNIRNFKSTRPVGIAKMMTSHLACNPCSIHCVKSKTHLLLATKKILTVM